MKRHIQGHHVATGARASPLGYTRRPSMNDTASSTAGARPDGTDDSVLAIVPARSGSKGIPGKNLRSFRGKPLLAHSIDQALAAQHVTRVLLSTDDEHYADVGRKYGADVPFLRPADIAGDLSTDLELFEHALRWLEEHERYRPAIVVHLRPTYPTRTVADIDAAVELLRAHPDADSVRSVALAPHTPYKMWRRDERTGELQPLLADAPSGAHSMPRQNLPRVYLQNAAVDVIRRETILAGSMVGTHVLGYVMDRVHDIDDDVDLEAAAWELGAMPTGKTIVFDLDGVIAQLVPGNDYNLCRAEPSGVEVVNKLHAAGNRIVIHTARGSMTGIDWRTTTEEQLQRWGVHYHELVFGKPAGDMYVDDRMIPFSALRRVLKP